MADGTVHLVGRPKDGGPGDVTQDYKGGGAKTRDDKAGLGVIGSTYSADKATSTTAANEAIPSGATMLWVCNESVTTLESVRFEFNTTGTSTAIATRGFRVSPGITTAAGDNGPKDLAVPVPSTATHWSWIAEAGTPTINVVWGG